MSGRCRGVLMRSRRALRCAARSRSARPSSSWLSAIARNAGARSSSRSSRSLQELGDGRRGSWVPPLVDLVDEADSHGFREGLRLRPGRYVLDQLVAPLRDGIKYLRTRGPSGSRWGACRWCRAAGSATHDDQTSGTLVSRNVSRAARPGLPLAYIRPLTWENAGGPDGI